MVVGGLGRPVPARVALSFQSSLCGVLTCTWRSPGGPGVQEMGIPLSLLLAFGLPQAGPVKYKLGRRAGSAAQFFHLNFWCPGQAFPGSMRGWGSVEVSRPKATLRLGPVFLLSVLFCIHCRPRVGEGDTPSITVRALRGLPAELTEPDLQRLGWPVWGTPQGNLAAAQSPSVFPAECPFFPRTQCLSQCGAQQNPANGAPCV